VLFTPRRATFRRCPVTSSVDFRAFSSIHPKGGQDILKLVTTSNSNLCWYFNIIRRYWPKLCRWISVVKQSKNHSYMHICIPCISRSQLSARSLALLEKPPVAQPPKNFATFYETRRFITMFTSARHWSLFWARRIQNYWVFGLFPSFGILEHRTMEKVQKLSNSERHAPSTEPFRIYQMNPVPYPILFL
jgi:hypothetical protein